MPTLPLVLILHDFRAPHRSPDVLQPIPGVAGGVDYRSARSEESGNIYAYNQVRLPNICPLRRTYLNRGYCAS
jgi:hypothetical protein